MADWKVYWLIAIFFILGFEKNYAEERHCLLNTFTVTQSAYLDDNAYLEYSIPDMETLSHLRLLWNVDSTHSYSIGVGALVFDIGFSVLLFKISNKYPVVIRFNLGESFFGQYLQNIVSLGLIDTPSWRHGINLSISMQSGGLGGLSHCMSNTENFQFSQSYYIQKKITEDFHINFMSGVTERFIINNDFFNYDEVHLLLNLNLSLSYRF